jgi:hypothetical protein
LLTAGSGGAISNRKSGARPKSTNAPTRLSLGSATVERIESKHAFVERELAAWRPVAISTGWTQASAQEAGTNTGAQSTALLVV